MISGDTSLDRRRHRYLPAVTEIVLHGARPLGTTSPRLGYAMVSVGAALFAVNGTVSKVILTETGMTTLRLTELRATGAFLVLLAFLALTAPGRLRVRRDELALLVFYGVAGFALVQWLYFVAIERLPIGIGLLLEFTAPVFWAVVQPWWGFPFELLTDTVSLQGAFESVDAPAWALCLWMVCPGTVVPFVLSLGALRHLPATRVSIVAMLEVVLASMVAWMWLGEALTSAQLVGGGVVLLGIVLAQTSR